MKTGRAKACIAACAALVACVLVTCGVLSSAEVRQQDDLLEYAQRELVELRARMDEDSFEAAAERAKEASSLAELLVREQDGAAGKLLQVMPGRKAQAQALGTTVDTIKELTDEAIVPVYTQWATLQSEGIIVKNAISASPENAERVNELSTSLKAADIALEECSSKIEGLPRVRRDSLDAYVAEVAETIKQTDAALEDLRTAMKERDKSRLFADLLSSGEVKSIRVIGDSICVGHFIDGYDLPSDSGLVIHPQKEDEGDHYETSYKVPSWTNRFRAYCAERGVTNFVNAGITSWRMSDLAEDPDAWIGDGADVIVVMLGTNDTKRDNPEVFRENAEKALMAADAACTHLVVVSPPENDRHYDPKLWSMTEVDEVLTDLCNKHGWEHASQLDTLKIHTKDFFADQVHPTESGSHKIWLAFAEQLGLDGAE